MKNLRETKKATCAVRRNVVSYAPLSDKEGKNRPKASRKTNKQLPSTHRPAHRAHSYSCAREGTLKTKNQKESKNLMASKKKTGAVEKTAGNKAVAVDLHGIMATLGAAAARHVGTSLGGFVADAVATAIVGAATDAGGLPLNRRERKELQECGFDLKGFDECIGCGSEIAAESILWESIGA